VAVAVAETALAFASLVAEAVESGPVVEVFVDWEASSGQVNPVVHLAKRLDWSNG